MTTINVKTDETPPQAGWPSRRRRGKETAKGDSNPLHILRLRRRDKIIIQVISALVTLWWLFPMFTATGTSVSVGRLQNYVEILTMPINGFFLANTFVNGAAIAAIHAVFVCAVSALAGYAFSQLEFRLRETMYYAVLICLAVPGTGLIVPIYYISGTLGLFNALPEAALTLPFGVLLIRNFADGLQASSFEGAEVDGANSWQVFRYVFLPQMRSPLSNLAILSIMRSFQDFVFPSLLLRFSWIDHSQPSGSDDPRSLRRAVPPTDFGVLRPTRAAVCVGGPAGHLRAPLGESGLTSGASKE